MNTVAMLVTDAQKSNVETFINDLTPEYTIGFIRKVCPIDPEPTWETAHTHWYASNSVVPAEVLAAWQEAAPTLEGFIMFTAINADNPLEWAYSNMASQGLMFLPDPEV